MVFDSVLLAQIFGPFFAILGLALLINKKMFLKMVKEMKNHYPVLIFGGAFNLFLGLLIVAGHNTWVKDWPVLITIIGWVMILKGVCLLLFPDSTHKMASKMASSGQYTLSGLVTLALGGYLCYVSWCPLLWSYPLRISTAALASSAPKRYEAETIKLAPASRAEATVLSLMPPSI